MAMFLAINGYKINASIDEQTEIILSVAAGKLRRQGNYRVAFQLHSRVLVPQTPCFKRNRFPSPLGEG